MRKRETLDSKAAACPAPHGAGLAGVPPALSAHLAAECGKQTVISVIMERGMRAGND